MNYPPNTMGSGVGEAYPMMMDQQEEAFGDNNANNHHLLDQSSVSTPRTAGGGGGDGGVIGNRRRRRSSTNSEGNRSGYTAASSYSRAIYEDAQSRASFQKGGILYHGQHPEHHQHHQQRLPPQPTTMMSSAMQQQHRGVSLSGNLLVHVQIEEEPDLELDKEEIRRLAHNIKEGEDAAAAVGDVDRYLNDTSTIGTTRSTQIKLLQHSTSKEVMVHGNPKEAILDPHFINDDGYGHSNEVDQARQKVKQIIFSPPFRRTLFLGICFVLLGLGVLLTLENFMSVKSAQDWMEPSRDKYLMMNGYGEGGNDWTFGRDAPRPIAGASIDHSVENNIADWARGTSRIPATASIDGYGSVALSETVMFKDVPLFWGLPFAGGSILESLVGQCLGLVQASGGTEMVSMQQEEDGWGDELHLSTKMLMGRKYLNVDLSTKEGIERASALALGTSGMADVIYSPLLHEVSELFTTVNQGRLFVMVRHPVEREFARFRYLTKWDHYKLMEGGEKVMSYSDFAHSEYVLDNWMTRTLVRKGKDEALTMKDMQTAKEILRRKALIGLYSDIIGAVRHYARYFGWDNAMNGGKLNKGTLACFERAILDGIKNDATHGGESGSASSFDLVEEEAKEGSVAWRKIMEKNKFDFELYLYSRQLYKFQIALS